MIDTLTLLIRVGHSRTDIFEVKQADLPYEGWSLAQLREFSAAAVRLIERERLTFSLACFEGIAAVLDKGARSKLQQQLNKGG